MLEKSRTTWKFAVITLVMLLSARGTLSAQKGFFFDIGADYLTRTVSANESFAVPYLFGGHAGFGWSLKKLDLSLEVGITGSAEGEHPVFGDIIQKSVNGLQIPLTVKGSYNVLPTSPFEIRPEAYLGAVWTDNKMFVFNPAYEGEAVNISSWAFLLGAGVKFSYGFGKGLTALYLGGYFDYRFNMASFATPETQLANFQLRGGVLIHPIPSDKLKRGYTGYKKSPLSKLKSSTASGVKEKSNSYIAGGLSANFGNIDNVLLSVLRKDLVIVDTPPPGEIDAASVLALMRQESTPLATSPMLELASVTETPSLKSAKEPKSATEPKPVKEIKETKEADSTEKKNDDSAKRKADFIKQQKQELAAMKAELQKQEALVSGDTTVVRTSSSSEKYSVSDLGNKDMDTIYYGPEEIKNPVVYSIPTLDAVGQKLQANQGLFVTIRGYSAAAGSKAGQDEVSEKRARYCAAYIINKYNIQSDRIVLEWYGAAKKPEKSLPYNEIKLNRAVELIVSPLDKVAVAPKKR